RRGWVGAGGWVSGGRLGGATQSCRPATAKIFGPRNQRGGSGSLAKARWSAGAVSLPRFRAGRHLSERRRPHVGGKLSDGIAQRRAQSWRQAILRNRHFASFRP